MDFIYATGGREKYFKAENVGDCVTRAIANATGIDYKVIYNRLKELAEKESVKRHKGHKKSSVRDGVFKETIVKYLKEIGWVYCSAYKEDGTRMTLTKEDLPKKGTYIVKISKHLTCVKDGVIYDTYNCSEKQYFDRELEEFVVNDHRTIYGYWRMPNKIEALTFAQVKQANEEKALRKEQAKKEKEQLKKKNDAIIKAYAKKINKLKAELRKLENERDAKLIPLPDLRKY